MIKKLCMLPLILLPSMPLIAAELTVDISGIKSNQKGELMIQLFKTEKNWMNEDKVLVTEKISVTARKQSITFSDLEDGKDYALSVIHDKNKNGKMDMSWFPFPSPDEGVGLSNNKFSMGQPDFEDAQFSVEGDTTISLKLKYY
jgi:uncharacterized protein (DUF2141 family)